MRKFGMLAILLGAFGLTLSGCSGGEEDPAAAVKGEAGKATEAAKDAAADAKKAAEDAAKTQPK